MTILITGGTGKVGKQLVKHFLNKGNIVITTTTKIENVKLLLSEYNIEVQKRLKIIVADFTFPNAILDIIKYLESESEKPEVIIHNARSLSTLKVNDQGITESEDFINEFQMGVVFPYELSMNILKLGALKNIIFVSSMYGVVAPSPSLYNNFNQASMVQYGVTKAAQIHLTKELAVRLAEHKVRVNCISLGGIQGRVDEEFLKRYKNLNPQGNMLQEEDVIEPIEFLVSDGSKNMTGHNLIVDGGWTIW